MDAYSTITNLWDKYSTDFLTAEVYKGWFKHSVQGYDENKLVVESLRYMYYP